MRWQGLGPCQLCRCGNTPGLLLLTPAVSPLPAEETSPWASARSRGGGFFSWEDGRVVSVQLGLAFSQSERRVGGEGGRTGRPCSERGLTSQKGGGQGGTAGGCARSTPTAVC